MMRKIFVAGFKLWKRAGRKWKTLLAKHTCETFGKGSIVQGTAFLDTPWNIRIGSGVRINEGVYMNARTTITIDDGVHISSFCIINSASLVPGNLDEHVVAPVFIEKDVWLASRVTIGPGVRIGQGAIVAAGAVVVEDVAPFTLVGGVPAREIKRLA